ncbi:MAG: PEGA domain-containing protein [Gemmataceae bacterium]|nr:PEGA domain-containing protein [Gemmataceae bacterium]
MKFFRWIAFCFLFLPLLGCVTRKYTIDSQPQGAMVYKDGKPIGVTPMDDHFTYYGKYKFKLVKDGYEPLDMEQKIPTPWYEYPPLDFISENLFPYEIHNIHRFSYQLQPLQPVLKEELINKATHLREKGKEVTPFAPVLEKKPLANSAQIGPQLPLKY